MINYNTLIIIRETIIRNTFLKIHSIKINNYILYYNIYIFLIDFWIKIFNYFNIEIIYSYDNYYNTNKDVINVLTPPIISFNIYYDVINYIDITKKIGKYNNKIPLHFIIYHELINNNIKKIDSDNLRCFFTFIKNNKINSNIVNICNFKYKYMNTDNNYSVNNITVDKIIKYNFGELVINY
jgi:hypothetical protein